MKNIALAVEYCRIIIGVKPILEELILRY